MKFFGWVLLTILTIFFWAAIFSIALLAPGCARTASGQTPTPAPDPIAPDELGLPLDFVEHVPSRSARSTQFIRGTERRAIVWAAPEFYQPQGGGWRRKRPKFAADGQDWVTIDNDIQVALRKGTKSIVITDANGDGVRFPLGTAATQTSDTTFTANVGAVTLTYTLMPEGVKASATVPGSLGNRTWSVPYELVGAATATIGLDGSAFVGPFHLPRPIATGADGRTYPIGGTWSLQSGSRLQVTLDDTGLPPAAFPYELDPTATRDVATFAGMQGLNISYNTAHTTYYQGTNVLGMDKSGVDYAINRFFATFDVQNAGIPVYATITGATFNIRAYSDQSTQDFNIRIAEYAWTGASDTTQFVGCLNAAVSNSYQVLATSAGFVGGTWYESAALGTSWISLTASTPYCILSDRDIAGTVPTTSEYVTPYTTHEGSKMFLDITYEILPTPTRTATSAVTATPTPTPIPPAGCCDCEGRNLNNCVNPILVANTPTCPTLAPAEPACTYIANAECGPR